MICLLAMTPSLAMAELVTFENLPSPPPLDASQGLFFANNSSAVYEGITWGEFSVFGNQYSSSGSVGGIGIDPLFGNVHGNYGVSNSGGAASVSITTNMVLTSSFWGRNEYFGFGGGADQITIHVMSGANEIATKVVDLPNFGSHNGLEEASPLEKVDTSEFLNLHGITGYVITRHEPRDFADNWVADDFTFVAPSTVPEPSSLGLMAVGVIGFFGTRLVRRRKITGTAAN